jgi:hypothetical protein
VVLGSAFRVTAFPPKSDLPSSITLLPRICPVRGTPVPGAQSSFARASSVCGRPDHACTSGWPGSGDDICRAEPSREFAHSGRTQKLCEKQRQADLGPGARDVEQIPIVLEKFQLVGPRPVVDPFEHLDEIILVPPSEGTLIEAMQNAWRFVDDEVLRERLKEAKGIAPATERSSSSRA